MICRKVAIEEIPIPDTIKHFTGKTMEHTAINFLEKIAKFSEHWSPKVVAQMNDYQFNLVKIQ